MHSSTRSCLTLSGSDRFGIQDAVQASSSARENGLYTFAGQIPKWLLRVYIDQHTYSTCRDWSVKVASPEVNHDAIISVFHNRHRS